MKPFIHTFLLDNEHYMYDVNKNQVIKVTSESYEILEEIKKEDKSLNDELLELKNRGYLSSNRPEVIRHPATDSLDTLISRNLSLLTIQLTQNCNLRCSYCPYTSNDGTNRVHSNKSIDIEVAKKAILFLKDHSVDSDKVAIGFYGGEPLLEEKLLIELVEYAGDIFQGKNIAYTITTNGTLLKYDMLKFFQDNKFNLVFSLDGPKNINDANRKYLENDISVFESVINKINLVYEKFPDLFESTSINMVIDPVNSLEEYERLFKEIDVLKKINVSASILEDYYKNDKNKYSESFITQYNLRKKQYVDLLFKENKNSEIYNNVRFYNSLFLPKMKKIINGLYYYDTLGNCACPSGQCYPGHTRLMVDINGNFYPCERVSEECEFNIIGNVYDGLDNKKTNFILNIGNNGGNDCSNCFAISHCEMCIKRYEKKLRNKIPTTIEECEITRQSFQSYLIEKIKFDKEYLEV